MPKRFLRFWAQKMLRNNIGFMCRVSRIEKAPGGDQNEKNSYLHRIDRSRVCPCNCVEHSEHDLGRHPVRLGLRFLPCLLRVSLCPARRREESCVRCCLGVLRRILGDRFNSRIARRERHHFRHVGVGGCPAAYRVLWAELYHERLQRFLFRAHRPIAVLPV